MANGMLTISLQAHWQIEARGSDGEGRYVRLCTCLCERISERGRRSASLVSEHTVLVQLETKHEKNVSDASDGVSERCQSLNWKPPSPGDSVYPRSVSSSIGMWLSAPGAVGPLQ